MSELDLRKQALLAESGLNRLALRGEVRCLRAGVGRWTGVGWRSVGPWLAVAAPVAGWLVARGFGRPAGLGPLAVRAVAVLPALVQVWRAVRGGHSKTD